MRVTVHTYCRKKVEAHVCFRMCLQVDPVVKLLVRPYSLSELPERLLKGRHYQKVLH